MAREDAVNRVGLGVDLDGGPETITQLRTIRSEMQGIASAAGAIPKNVGGSTASYVDPNQASLFDKEMNRQGRLFDDIQRQQTRSHREQLTVQEKDFLDSQKRKRAELERTERLRKQTEEKNARSVAPVTKEDVDLKLGQRKRTSDLNLSVFREEQAALLKTEGIHSRINRNAELTAKEREAATTRERQGLVNLYQYQEAATLRNRTTTIKALQEEAAMRQRNLALRQAEARSDVAGRSGGDITTLRQQGRLFQRYRNDPARGEQDDIYRTDIARDLRATRNTERADRDRRAERQRQQQSDRAEYEAQRRRDEQDEARRAEAEALRARTNREAYFGRDNDIRGRIRRQEKAYQDEVVRDRNSNVDRPVGVAGKLIDSNNTQRKALQKFIGGVDPSLDADSRALFAKLTEVSGKAQQLKIELLDVNRTRPLREIVEDLNLVEREQRQAIEGFRELKTAQIGIEGPNGPIKFGPGGRGPGGPPNKTPNLRDPQGLLNEKGFFTSGDALGRITRNILLYEVVSRATYGLVDYIGKSIEAAKTTVEFSNALRFATETAHGNLAANESLVESLRPLGLSRQQSRAAVTEAARFTESRPEDIDKLTKITADIAAERGGGIDRTDELIEQLRRRESKFYKRIFGKTVESIYEDEAKTQVANRSQTPSSLFIDKSGDFKKDFKTQAEQIKDYVQAMDDAQKENAVLNYILSQGNRFQGEAAERAQTLAGKLDLIAASFLNAQEGVGLFITEIKPLSDILGSLVGKVGVLDQLRAPTLGRTGQGGTITDADVQQFGIDKTTGPRAKALDAINNFGTTGLLGAGAIGVAALIGRRKATEDFRLKEYNKLYDVVLEKFEGNMTAAQNEAVQLAKSKKAGFVRSVGAGFDRLTLGLTNGVNELTASASERLGATNAANRSKAYSTLLSGGRLIKPAGQTLEEFNAQNQKAIDAGPSGLQKGGAIAGGVLGGIVGAEVGSFIAKEINAGPIVATSLTILGSVAGTAIGTAAGSAVGGAVAGSVAAGGGVAATLAGSVSAAGIVTAGAAIAAAALVGYGIGTIINSLIPKELPFFGRVSQEREDERLLKIEEAKSGAYAKQAKERNQAQLEGRIRYRPAGESITDLDGLSQEQINELAKKGQLKNFDFTNAATNLFTGDEVAKRGDGQGNGKGGLLNYIEVIIPAAEQLKGVAKTLEEFRQAREKVLNDKTEGLDTEITTQTGFKTTPRQQQLNALQAKQDADFSNPFGNTDKGRQDLQDYRKDAEERERKRVEKEQAEAAKLDKAKQERINQQGNALSKLRDAAQGSFRLVGDIGTSIAGTDNQFVKPLADQITVAERMRQQWGFLGQGAVDYFTKLEKGAISLQLIRLQFDALTNAMKLNNQAAKERDERNGPGLTRKETDAQGILEAVANANEVDRNSFARERELTNPAFFEDDLAETGKDNRKLNPGLRGGPLLRQRFTKDGDQPFYKIPEQTERKLSEAQNRALERRKLRRQREEEAFEVQNTREQINNTEDEIASYGRKYGASQRTIDEITERSTEKQLQGLTGRQIRGDEDLTNRALVNAGLRRQEAGRKIEDEIGKAAINEREDARLKTDFSAIQSKRDQLLNEARNATGQTQEEKIRAARDIGQEYDRSIIARTDGIPQKDLTLDQFEARQNALKEEARRTVEQEAEARAAVKKGLEYQESMNKELQIIREAILGGDVKMLVQVQNDTQARIDQEALVKADGKGYNVPLDQSETKSNPYSGQLGRYGRGGRKR